MLGLMNQSSSHSQLGGVTKLPFGSFRCPEGDILEVIILLSAALNVGKSHNITCGIGPFRAWHDRRGGPRREEVDLVLKLDKISY